MKRLLTSLAAGLLVLTVAVPVGAADAVPTDAVYVTGRDDFVALTHDVTTESDGDVTYFRNGVFSLMSEMDDPRASGAITFAFSADAYPPTGAGVQFGTMRIENDGGAWTGPCAGGARYLGDPYVGSCWLTGSGDYEGFTYYRQHVWGPSVADRAITEGLIFPGVPPTEFPELPTPTSTSAEESSTAAPPETIGEPGDDGARIIEVEELGERTVDLTIDSPAVGTQKVRLLLPAGFDSDTDADWPVLYLLHGGGNDYLSWTLETDVEELTADLDLLVVMPEAGADGWYSDWWNGGEGGPPMWETFHATEVRELLERNWRAGDERVVAGLSMGGFGAMSYAARYPGLFKAAASFSGMLHPITLDPIALGFDVPPDVWGSRTEQSDIWEAHDPVLLAPALEGITLYVSYGNGEPGPLDAADAGFDDLEASSAEMNEAFVTRLAEFGIPITVDAYGPGTHAMPYVERGLHEAMPLLLEALGM